MHYNSKNCEYSGIKTMSLPAKFISYKLRETTTNKTFYRDDMTLEFIGNIC